jgi:hypothetical protein
MGLLVECEERKNFQGEMVLNPMDIQAQEGVG